MVSQLRFLLWSGLVVVAIGGCGPSEQPFTDNSQDAEAFAKSIKSLVLNTAESAKKSAQPADTLRGLVTALSELENAPVGTYGPTYEELLVLAKGLLEKSESGKPSDFQPRLAEISKLAQTLPGDVEVVTELSD